MPAIAAKVVNDGQATPVAHTFNPTSIDANGVAHFRDATQSLFDAQWLYSQSVRLPIKGSQVSRVQFKFELPVMDSVTPSLRAGVALATLEFVVPKRATLQDRKDLLAMIRNWMYVNFTESAVWNQEHVY